MKKSPDAKSVYLSNLKSLIAMPPRDEFKGLRDEGEVDFDGIFETLRDMDFVNKQLKLDARWLSGFILPEGSAEI